MGGGELLGCGSECECVWIQVVHRVSVSTGGDPSRARESEAKAAGQRSVLGSVRVVIV